MQASSRRLCDGTTLACSCSIITAGVLAPDVNVWILRRHYVFLASWLGADVDHLSRHAARLLFFLLLFVFVRFCTAERWDVVAESLQSRYKET